MFLCLTGDLRNNTSPLAQYTRLTDLSLRGIDKFPEIGALALKKLDLFANTINYLPPLIGSLVHLTILDLDSNNLVYLPSEIGLLTQLEVLNLGENFLQVLPSEIGQLQSLTHLGLGENQLRSLPIEIGQLKKLSNLDLSYNRLLPKELNRLSQSFLRLNIRGNLGIRISPIRVQRLAADQEIRAHFFAYDQTRLYFNLCKYQPLPVELINSLPHFEDQTNRFKISDYNSLK